MGDSVSFDHAAEFYDVTRADPAWVAANLTDALLAERSVIVAGSVLEVGIGTGRIARPLSARGVRVVGVDIAPLMLAQLTAQLQADGEPPDLLLADATRLPFVANTFRMAMMTHVLHLVSDWRQTVAETVRVLEDDGVFVHVVTSYPEPNPWTKSKALWDEIVTSHQFQRRTRPTPDEIAGELRSHGGKLRENEFARLDDRLTPGDNLERMRQRIDSWTWEYPDELFGAFFSEFEPRYRVHYGDMDTVLINTGVHQLEVWSFGG